MIFPGVGPLFLNTGSWNHSVSKHRAREDRANSPPGEVGEWTLDQSCGLREKDGWRGYHIRKPDHLANRNPDGSNLKGLSSGRRTHEFMFQSSESPSRHHSFGCHWVAVFGLNHVNRAKGTRLSLRWLKHMTTLQNTYERGEKYYMPCIWYSSDIARVTRLRMSGV